MKNYLFIFLLICFISVGCNARKKWDVDKANDWSKKNGWLRGANFIPSTAINQLEMWQKESFDPATIDRELGWAENVGMNCMRVFLHHLAWEIDRDGFKDRMRTYLEIASRHSIKTIFVFFDDCWNPTYQAGKQPEPKPGVHNSGWVRDPGDIYFKDNALVNNLEAYVKDILKTFSKDNRIILWDLYNEPGNTDYGDKSIVLVQKVFNWAWDIRPRQPLTSGVCSPAYPNLNKVQLESSDIITYHNYDEPENQQQAIDSLKKYNRPVICTEYMARSRNSLFQNTMPLLKKNNVGAISWGLVTGKTNTRYAWNEPVPDGAEPKLWFHDIFRKDGSPYKKDEVDLIRSLSARD